MNEHLITNNIEGKKALKIFESFEIDINLPKYKDKVNLGYKSNTDIQSQGNFSSITAGVWNTDSTNSIVFGTQSSRGFTQNYDIPREKFSLIRYLCEKFKKKAKEREIRIANAKAIPVTQIFEAIMGGGKKLENLTARLEDYQKSIEYAKSMGQVALAEKLERRLPLIQSEAILVAANFTHCIEEEQMIDFILKCEKGLRLDWVKNFIRLIPPFVQVKKIKLDELRIFDNYVILHYDPDQKAAALTKKEIEKKKDPILFGLIKESRRLYHVGSWKDEFCDLSFSDIVAKYGKEVLTLK